MKRITYVLSVLSIIIVAGCAETGKDRQKAERKLTPSVDTLTFEQRTPICEGSDYGFDMSMKIEWPKKARNRKVLESMQKGISGLLFGNNLVTTDVEFAMEAYNSASVELYLDNNMMDEGFPEDSYAYIMNWSEYKEGRFMQPYREMISYQSYVYGYSGGAHGMDALCCKTFNMATGKEVRSEDLFIEDHEDRLIASLRANLLCSIDDTDMLFEKDIYPSKDFYVTPEGITYIYQRYEIAPYVMGIIEVTIPWKEIKDILKTEKTSGRAS